MVLFNEGIGEGTITKIPNDFGVYVKWDRVDSEIYYNQEYLPVYCNLQGYAGVFPLKLADKKPWESKKWKKIGRNAF